MNHKDLKSWKTTAIILGIISISIFIVQRSRYMFMDPVFELCIFHMPAILAVSIYMYYKEKTTDSLPALQGV